MSTSKILYNQQLKKIMHLMNKKRQELLDTEPKRVDRQVFSFLE